MNYQMLLECYASGSELSEQEIEILDLELETQIESLKLPFSQECIQVAPVRICESAFVCEGSFWITCLASVLDKLVPRGLANLSRGKKVFEVLVQNKYLIVD